MTTGDGLSGRQAWFANPRTDAAGRVRPGAHLAALRARIAAESAAAARLGAPPNDGDKHGQWNPLGPAGVGLGSPDARPRVSGRVTSIAAHRDGQRAYIGTANGGTWYTDDAGQHWRCLDTYAETSPLTGRALGDSDALAVGAIDVQWGNDASTDVVYVGTGEPFRKYGGDSFYGVGIRVATGPATVDPLDPRKATWTTEATNLANKAIYKLACDPSRSGVVYAATTDGLYRRGLNPDGTPADPTTWAQVFAPSPSICAWIEYLRRPLPVVCDVVIAPAAAGSSPQTVYLAVYEPRLKSDSQVWQSQTGNRDSWQPVPGYTANERTSLAVAPQDPTALYALSCAKAPPDASESTAVQTILAVLINGTFEPVSGAPENLAFQHGNSQADYDIVVAVDPVDKRVIWMGGSAKASPPGNSNASLFRGTVNLDVNAEKWLFQPADGGNPATPGWVGAGAHADVHAIAFSGPAAATATVWLGCDGGVFQSSLVTPPPPGARGQVENTAVGPWQSINTCLAITQPNYLAQWPSTDFLVIAGTQDNGLQGRVGPAVWRLENLGDGGGCAINPAHPCRRFGQVRNFICYITAAPRMEYEPTLYYENIAGPVGKMWQSENNYAAFYSHAATRVLGNGKTALIFGSHRVWYCEDWGASWMPGASGPGPKAAEAQQYGWRTLPTGTNPYELKDSGGQAAPDITQDSLSGMVIRVAFASDTDLLALTQAWSAEPSWSNAGPAALYHLVPNQKPVRLSPPDPNQPAPPPAPDGAVDRFPEGEIPQGLAVDQLSGQPLACYVTLGAGQKNSGTEEIDHVWWYDGTHWWPCKFDENVADTPVNAIVVDKTRNVYVGTDVGVFMGVPSTVGAIYKWTWTLFSDGLPEAPVLDLALLEQPFLLRAATHGRGLWELNLTEVAPSTTTYLRAHFADTRWVLPTTGVDPTADGANDPVRIDASPDIVITCPADPPPPSDLPLSEKFGERPHYSESTRMLKYALRQRQIAAVPPSLASLPPVVTDGYYDVWTNLAVYTFQQATPGLEVTGQVGVADWKAIVTYPYANAVAGPNPTYLDVSLLDTICPLNGTSSAPSLITSATGAYAYVQVNARGWTRRPAGAVNVGLLATPNFDASLASLPDLPGNWVTQFGNAVKAPPATWLTGSTSWAWIGSPATMATTRPLHPEEPQVVRFTVTFPMPPGATTLPTQWTLFAVVDDDPLDRLKANATSVQELVLNDWHTAVRSVTLSG